MEGIRNGDASSLNTHFGSHGEGYDSKRNTHEFIQG